MLTKMEVKDMISLLITNKKNTVLFNVTVIISINVKHRQTCCDILFSHLDCLCTEREILINCKTQKILAYYHNIT